MASTYTTAKVNPITGEPSKKENRQVIRSQKRADRALNKSLNEGIEKQGRGLKQYYKGTPVEESSSTPKQKDWRDKSKPDTGGKKGIVVKGGKGGRVNYNKMDASCKKPK